MQLASRIVLRSSLLALFASILVSVATPAIACRVILEEDRVQIELVAGANPVTPTLWLTEFEAAYESGDVARYAACLAPEFRFHFGDEENRRRRPGGWPLPDELASFTNIHRGVVREDGTRLPRALAVDVAVTGVRVLADPDHPNSDDHVLVWVGAATLDLQFEGGGRAHDVAPHAFHLVRGRALGLADARRERWFARVWIERPQLPDAALAAEVDDDCGCTKEGEAGGSGKDVLTEVALAAALPRGGRLWPNPAHSARGVTFGYDAESAEAEARLSIFDVSGRRIAELGPVRGGPGRRTLAWDGRDAGGRAAPAGVYFVRAQLAGAEFRHRVILID